MFFEYDLGIRRGLARVVPVPHGATCRFATSRFSRASAKVPRPCFCIPFPGSKRPPEGRTRGRGCKCSEIARGVNGFLGKKPNGRTGKPRSQSVLEFSGPPLVGFAKLIDQRSAWGRQTKKTAPAETSIVEKLRTPSRRGGEKHHNVQKKEKRPPSEAWPQSINPRSASSGKAPAAP